MKEIKGDFWASADNYDALICTTNGVVKLDGDLVMGAGMALQFAKRFPDLARALGHRVTTRGNYPAIIEMEDTVVISMPTKEHFKNKSTLDLIEKSAILVEVLVDIKELKKVLCTRPGCGLGGMLWHKVSPVLANIWDDRFHIIDKE